MEYLTEGITNSEKELLVFSLNNNLYGVESESILEIIKLIELEIPEKLPENVAGIIKYESYFINVIDLKGLFGIKNEKYSLDNKILIASCEDSIFAFIVDKVLDIKKVKKDAIQTSPFKNDASYSEAFCNIDNENVTIINLDVIDSKIKNSLQKEKKSNNAVALYPDDEKSLKILKNRKIEFQKKESLETLANYYIEQDALTFEINDGKYCVEISYVKNFYKLKSSDSIVKIPGTQNFILGLLNIKGEFTPIIDLHRYLNLEKTEVKNNSIIVILELNDVKLGILADKIGARIDIRNELETHKMNQGGEIKQEFVNFVRDDIIYSILLPEEFFKSEKLRF